MKKTTATTTTNTPKEGSYTFEGKGDNLSYTGEAKFVDKELNAITISFQDSSWSYTLRYVLGYILIPILVVLSRLLKRRINF